VWAVWAFDLQLRKKDRKTSVRVVEKCPDIPVAAVQHTFTHKQYQNTENGTYITINKLNLHTNNK
jgi:NADP-dependent 3-hydroxy acid dehydrogenase YdfG